LPKALKSSRCLIKLSSQEPVPEDFWDMAAEWIYDQAKDKLKEQVKGKLKEKTKEHFKQFTEASWMS
jgi:hypothetical protein